MIKKTALVASLVLMASSAFATPVVFEVIQAWGSTSNSATFGSAADLFITVDNGSSSAANQTYTWANITNIRYATIGGTFDLSSNGTQYGSFPAFAFLTTDGAGLGTMLIDNSGNNGAYFNVAPLSGGFAQFGAAYYTNLYYADNSDYAMFNASGNWQAAATQVGAAVPEPTTIATFGLALLGLAASRRRKA